MTTTTLYLLAAKDFVFLELAMASPASNEKPFPAQGGQALENLQCLVT